MRKHKKSAFFLIVISLLSHSFSIAQDCTNDISPPEFTVAHPLIEGISSGDTVLFQCGTQVAFFEDYLEANDNCDPSPSVQFSKDVALGNCITEGFMVMVDYCWSATDFNQNSSQFCFKVMVFDEELPYLDQLPMDLTIDLAAGETLPLAPTVTAMDDCHGVVNVLLQENLNYNVDSCGYEMVRTWSTMDGCGNEASHTQSIIAIDDCQNAMPPTTDTINITMPCGITSSPLCTNYSDLPGTPSIATICAPPVNGSVTPLNDTCFTYHPLPDFFGNDEVCMSICDDLGVCDTFQFLIEVEQCPQQFPCVVIPQDTLFAQANQCDDEVKFCVEFPLGELLDYDFEVNAEPYSGNLSVCAFDTIVSYGFSAIPGNAMNGPYEISSWFIDGTNIGGGSFEDVFELIELMNMLDLQGNWALDSITFNISSFNTSSQYGQMNVTQTATGDIAMLNINSATAPTGSALYFPVGVHEVIMTHQEYSFCVDTFTAFIHCAETEVIVEEILNGSNASLCPEFDLPGQNIEYQYDCIDCGQTAYNFSNGCIEYQGLNIGTDNFLLVACDEFGFCDTVLLTINVVENGLPLAYLDVIETNENIPVSLDALANDFINGSLISFRIIIDPVHAFAEINPDQTITFTPDRGFCGLDAIAYEICNEVGCDTTAVEIEVICTNPVVFNGFSPNEDGINDLFKISNLHHFPKNELKVFNRWGSEVYTKKNYDNSWDGRDFDSSILPDGTYFYLLDLGNGESKSGYLQIHR